MAARQFISCAQCGKSFKQLQDGGSYCSRACYDKDRAPAPKTCAQCGVVFVKVSNHQSAVFCSKACQVESRRVKPHACVTCGALFSPLKFKPSIGKFVGATGRHNCSAKCIFNWKSKTKSAYMRSNRDRFSGPNSWNWKGSCLRKNQSYRGPDWNAIAEKIRARDRHACVHCGMTQDEHSERWSKALEVHHKVPFFEFTNHRKANRPSNLVTLCKSCHMAADRAIRSRQFLLPLNEPQRKMPRDGVHRGSANGRAILNEAQVSEIKLRLREGHDCEAIGEVYGVTKHVIRAIRSGKNWSHVP